MATGDSGVNDIFRRSLMGTAKMAICDWRHSPRLVMRCTPLLSYCCTAVTIVSIWNMPGGMCCINLSINSIMFGTMTNCFEYPVELDEIEKWFVVVAGEARNEWMCSVVLMPEICETFGATANVMKCCQWQITCVYTTNATHNKPDYIPWRFEN